jgi:hypothetical protein
VPAAAVQAFLREAFVRNLGDGPCDPTRLHFTVPAHGDLERPFDSCAFGFQFAEPAAGRSSRSHLCHQRRQLRTLGLFRKKFRRALGFLGPRELRVRRLSLQAEQSSRDPSSKPDLPIYKHFQDFVAGPRFGAFSDYRFHFSLIPVPYAGDLVKADIFVLQLNPGLNPVDYYAELCSPKFRKRLESYLRQQFSKTEFPFLYFDPEFCWHSGFIWWGRKFREVARAVADHKFRGRYLDALRDLSKRVASLELVPYHSVSFADHRAVRHLPSAKQARLFACGELANGAASEHATVIITRRLKDWDAPQDKKIVQYPRQLWRGASLGTNTPGGKAILQMYGL